MNVHQALAARKSVRAFQDRALSRDDVIRVLDSARTAPSGVNAQPWQVAVVMGKKKETLQKMIEDAFRNGKKPCMDYHYYPLSWREPYKTRRFQCGLQLYKILGINRGDKERRMEQWIANYRAFEAPVVLYFFMDSDLETGSYMDYGMFLQSVMLAAIEEGFATCPQAALGEYPAIVKRFLGYPEDSILICGMALGYEDTAAKVNHYRTPREPVESFTRFYDE